MKTLLIYHNADLGGLLSGAIVYDWFKKTRNKNDAINIIGWNYGDPMPNHEGYNRVIVVDISFPPKAMYRIQADTIGNFIWIDHHKSAIEAMTRHIMTTEDALLYGEIKGLRDTKYAACELAYSFFNDVNIEDVPELVKYLGMYDSFRHIGTPEEDFINEFQYGMRVIVKDIESMVVVLKKYDDKWRDEARSYGVGAIETLKNIYWRIGCKEIMLDGTVFYAVNLYGINPKVVGDDNNVAMYHKIKEGWKFTLYSNKVDCAAIAETFGGGGHKGTAGFIIDDIEEFLKLYAYEKEV